MRGLGSGVPGSRRGVAAVGALVALTMGMITTPAARATPAQRPDVAAKVPRIEQFARTAFPRTAELWPGVDFSSAVFVVRAGERLVRIGATSSEEIDPKRYADRTGFFTYLTSGPDRGIYLNLNVLDADALPAHPMSGDALEDEAILTPFHEAFHALVQPDWKLPGQGRATRYPFLIGPRLARDATMRRLIEAEIAPTPTARDQALARAAYWYERWKRRYPDEYREIKGNDIKEGTATYFQIAGLALWKSGNARPETIRPLIAPWLPTRTGLPSAEEESYGLGATAGLLLDQRGPADWKTRLADGASPLDLLLDPIQPAADRIDPETRRKLTRTMKERNQAAKATLDRALPHLRNPRYVRVGLSAEATGSVDPGFFVTTRGNVSWYAAFTGVLRAGGRAIGLDAFPVITAASEECDFKATRSRPVVATLVLPARRVRLRDGRLTVRGVKGVELRGAKARSGGRVDRQRVYCIR